MTKPSKLSFISDADLKEHVRLAIQEYGKALKPMRLEDFNKNIVDPIKLIFDKNVYNYTWEGIIKHELYRQRDKSSNNSIGYFHQRIFKYIKGCRIPKKGWDVIVEPEGGIDLPECGHVERIYVEMKNKHNTMNSASSSKTYMKMQGMLLDDDKCACCLVEAIAAKSQNITWEVTLDEVKRKHNRIRRLSMDEFYYLVTGERDAFYKLCMVLPSVIEEVISEEHSANPPSDTVFQELKALASKDNLSFEMALYMLGFSSYLGFPKK